MSITMREMLEAGVHFGHQTRFWNPKMAPYIFGARNKIHIVNLEQSLPMFEDAMKFVRQLAANRGTILLVGTKRAARDIIAEEAKRAGIPYVNQRWLGGMLTNFKTVKTSIKRLKDMKAQQEAGLDSMSKKEQLTFTREIEKRRAGEGMGQDMFSQFATTTREDGSLLVGGTLPVEDLRELMDGAALPDAGDGDYHTLAGMCIAHFGRIPNVGEHFDWAGWRIEVVDLDGARVDKLLLTRLRGDDDDSIG